MILVQHMFANCYTPFTLLTYNNTKVTITTHNTRQMAKWLSAAASVTEFSTDHRSLVTTCYDKHGAWSNDNSLVHRTEQLFYGRGQPVLLNTSQLTTGGLCWNKVLLPTSPCWWQLLRTRLGPLKRYSSIYTISPQLGWTTLPSPSLHR